MATAPNMAPHEGEAALPALDVGFGRKAVFDKDELSTRLENPSHLA